MKEIRLEKRKKGLISISGISGSESDNIKHKFYLPDGDGEKFREFNKLREGDIITIIYPERCKTCGQTLKEVE